MKGFKLKAHLGGKYEIPAYLRAAGNKKAKMAKNVMNIRKADGSIDREIPAFLRKQQGGEWL